MTSTLADAVSAVHLPGSPEYDHATTPKNASGRQAPAAVVAATGAPDVVAAVQWARAHDHRVVVQATGHGFAGAVGDDTVLVDTSGLDTVEIEGRTARTGTGALWGAVNGAAFTDGLLGLSGSAPDVGVAGYTFHGGVGWLTRAHGLASAHLRAVEFVDGRGAVRQADAEQMWAFRGGGGVGIATALEFDLVPVPDLHAGFLLWPVAQHAEVVAAWSRVVADLPSTVSSGLGLLKAPDAPLVDAALHGRRTVHLSLACLDGPGAADALLAALPEPAQSTFGPCDATRLATIHLDPPVPVPAHGDGLWLTAATPEHAAAILTAVGAGEDAPLPEIEIRHVAVDPAVDAPPGALTRLPGPFVLHATGEAGAATEAALRAVVAAAGPVSTGVAAASFRDGQTDAAAFGGADAARLAAVAAAVDPDGVFRRVRRLWAG